MKLALANCLLVDGTGAVPRPGTTVVVEGAEIVDVGPRAELPAGTHVVDLAGRTVMPGLIDCHIHFALWALDLLSHQDEPISYLCAKTQQALRETLEAGCTAARDPGGLDVGFRDAIEAGICAGPRIQTSVTIVSPTNGIADSTKSQGLAIPYLPGMPTPECNGPVEARAKVREVVRAGADFIKIAVSGGVSSRRRSPHHRLFTEEEIAAIVDEAHAWGMPVVCHAIGGPGPLAAVRAGVDTIEHGGWLDEQCIAEMAARGTWYIPTFAGYEWHARFGGPLQKEYAEEMRESHLESFQRAREAGVRIACGSDAGVYGHDFKRELELLVSAGMTPSEAIAASTSHAAECLGWASEIGTLKPGLRADFLVVDGNPAEEIEVLRRANAIQGVFKSGVAVVDRLGIASDAHLRQEPATSELGATARTGLPALTPRPERTPSG